MKYMNTTTLEHCNALHSTALELCTVVNWLSKIRLNETKPEVAGRRWEPCQTLDENEGKLIRRIKDAEYLAGQFKSVKLHIRNLILSPFGFAIFGDRL